MTNKLMPEVPTDSYIAKLAKLWGYTFEEASSTYDLMYDSAPQVECEPVAWQYFEEYPDSTNKWWNAEEGDDKDAISECHPVRDLYTIPQDQSAKIAELEADKQKLIEALDMSAEDAKDWAMQYVTEDNAPVNVKEFVSSKFEKLLSEMKKG
jgi:hypothetical protein